MFFIYISWLRPILIGWCYQCIQVWGVGVLISFSPKSNSENFFTLWEKKKNTPSKRTNKQTKILGKFPLEMCGYHNSRIICFSYVPHLPIYIYLLWWTFENSLPARLTETRIYFQFTSMYGIELSAELNSFISICLLSLLKT